MALVTTMAAARARDAAAWDARFSTSDKSAVTQAMAVAKVDRMLTKLNMVQGDQEFAQQAAVRAAEKVGSLHPTAGWALAYLVADLQAAALTAAAKPRLTAAQRKQADHLKAEASKRMDARRRFTTRAECSLSNRI